MGEAAKPPFRMFPTVKISGSLERNARFGAPMCLVSSFWCSCGVAVSMGEAAKPPFRMFPTVKISGSLERNARFGAPMCLVSSLWCSCGFAVSMGEAAKPPFRMFPTVKISGSLERNARFGAPMCLVSSLWCSCGFAVSMGEAAKHLLFEGCHAGYHVDFCVAGAALCDMPTCLITFRKCQNWRKSPTKCSFCCAHVSRLESLVFLLPCCVHGGSCKTSPFRRFSSRLITCRKCQNWRKSPTKCSFCCAHVSRLESLVFLLPGCVHGGSCKTSPFRRFSSRLSCGFAWQVWHFVTCQPV